MTTLVDRSVSLPATDFAQAPATDDWRPRSELTRLRQQLDAIDVFTHARRQHEFAAAASARTRELRLDSDRLVEVLQRQQQALVERTHAQLQDTGGVLTHLADKTVLLAHRNQWFLDRVTDVLTQHGLTVIGTVDNGADAVGCAVAEQPDAVLIADSLAMLPGEDVVRELRKYCASSRLFAQVEHSDRVGALLEAGASAVFTRRVPPKDVAEGVCHLLAA